MHGGLASRGALWFDPFHLTHVWKYSRDDCIDRVNQLLLKVGAIVCKGTSKFVNSRGLSGQAEHEFC